jgi:16S rRNA C967 or C1407 C5-methylase (RsmB/RsmF family)
MAAAQFRRRVVAVDVSAPMLDVLEARLRQRGTTNVECVRASFLTYEHRGEQLEDADPFLRIVI